MFQFPGFALPTLYIRIGVTGHDPGRVSPFRHLRINACLPASRSLSQATTSFVASRCQDIHRTPFLTWPPLPITVGETFQNQYNPVPSGLPCCNGLGCRAATLVNVADRSDDSYRQKRCSKIPSYSKYRGILGDL